MGKQRLSDGVDVHYGEYAISGTTVIDSSRNLTNIGTITASGDMAIDTDTLFVDVSTDRVGINTSAPDHALDVAGNIGLNEYIYHNGDHNTYFRFQGDQITLRTGGTDRLYLSSSGVQVNNAYTLPTADGSANQVMQTDGSGNVSFATLSSSFSGGTISDSLTISSTGFREFKVDQTDSGSIRMGISSASAEGFLIAGNTGTNHVSTAPAIKFMLDVDGGSLTEMMRVTSTGVGIGSSPGVLFDVHKDSTSGQVAEYRNDTGFFIHRTYADYNNDGTTVEFQTRVGGDGNYSSIGNYSNNDFFIRTNNTDRLKFNGDGIDVRNSGTLKMGGTVAIDASRNLTNIGSITSSGAFRQTRQNVGIPTVYGQHTMEATDAQLDLVSSSSGTWGSAINFVEGASSSANTDVWSIARKTTGGAGDSSLNFNFGTNNQHDNTNRMLLSSTGNLNVTGNITASGASSPTLTLQDTTNNVYFKAYAQDSNAFVGTTSSHNLNIGTNNTTAINLDNSQNVSIQTQLEMSGTVVIDSSRVLQNVTANASIITAGTLSVDTSGNAATATTLETARTIGGVSFDGSANINLPGVNTAGNQNTSGTASHATNLNATDDRDIAPEDLGYGDDLRIYFADKGGLETGTIGSNYQDVLVLNSYNDATGGDANALAFDKSEKKIYHYQADQAATNWGTPKQIAYTDSNITGTAASLTTARTITLSGAVTGSTSFDGSGNVTISTTATADPTLTLSGDASGSATFTNLGNATLSVTIADDSHNHVISNIDGLADAFDNSYVTKEQASDLAVGWYTIATNTGDRAIGRFGLWDTDSSDHQAVVFYAAHHFGTDASNTITVLHNSRYSGSPFRYIRIKDAGTYDGAVLQVYIDGNTNALNVAILGDNFQSGSWVLRDWIPDATTPPSVSNYGSFAERSKVDLDNIDQGGIATTGEIYAGGDTSQARVFHDSYHPNADTLTTARTIGGVSFDGSANINLPGVNSAGNQNTSGTAAGLSGTPNITVGTISSGAITSSGAMTVNANIDLSSTDTAARYLHLPRGGGITLYGDTSEHHGIFSRDSANASADDLLISSYGGVHIDLDSNNNNTSGANFSIGKHNATQSIFNVSGENSNITVYGNMYIPNQILHSGDTDTYIQFHAANEFRVVTGGSERFEVSNSTVKVTNDLIPGSNDTYDLGSTANAWKELHVEDIRFHNASGAVGGIGQYNTGGDIEILSDHNIIFKETDANAIKAVFGMNGPNFTFGQTTENTSYRVYVNGSIASTADVTAYASDERLKTNIVEIDSAIEKVKQLRGVTFDWQDDVEEKGFEPAAEHETGVIAQEVQKVIPDAVVPAPFDPEYWTVKHEKIIPVLIEAIKEQQKEIEQLKKHSHPAKDMCDMKGYEELVARIEKMEKNYGNN
jgi:hypothetical protein